MSGDTRGMSARARKKRGVRTAAAPHCSEESIPRSKFGFTATSTLGLPWNRLRISAARKPATTITRAQAGNAAATLASIIVTPPKGSSIFQSVVRLERPAARSTQSQDSTLLTLPERGARATSARKPIDRRPGLCHAPSNL